MRIAVAYHSQHGHTAQIAEHMASAIRGTGHDADVLPIVEDGTRVDLAAYSGVIVAAPVYASALPAPAIDFIRNHYEQLREQPNLLVTVGLTIVAPQHDSRSARRAADAMVTLTGWVPDETYAAAGALRYTDYGWFLRLLMRFMAQRSGLATDTSRDHVYTDWNEVDDVTLAFLARAEARPPETPPMRHRTTNPARL